MIIIFNANKVKILFNPSELMMVGLDLFNYKSLLIIVIIIALLKCGKIQEINLDKSAIMLLV